MDEGPSGTPDSVVDDADGTLTARVNVILPDTTSRAGRRVRITYELSGAYEDLTVARVAGQNVVNSAGDLGQTVISGTASNYTVEVIDETSIMLADPFGVLMPVVNNVRVYKDFDARGEAFADIAHMDLTANLLRPDAVVYVNGFYLPRIV